MRQACSLLRLLALVAILTPRGTLISAQDTAVSTERGKARVMSHIIEFAPEVELANGNGDMDPAGACKAEAAAHCPGVAAGESRLADCLGGLVTAYEMEDEGEPEVSISDACLEEVYQFKITRNSNINANVPLATACEADANKFCNVTWFFGYKEGQVIACLRDVQDRVAPACKAELFKVKLDAAMDFRADPFLFRDCKLDASSLCPDVKPRGGRIQACLLDHRKQLSWACKQQLFRQEVENADDVRLSVRLYKTCLKDKRRFCPDVAPGAARVKDCLEKSRREPEFSPECLSEVDGMIERRTRDYRLDSRLRTACEAEIYAVCAYVGDLDDNDSSNIYCLHDSMENVNNTLCSEQVRKYQALAAEDVRFDPPLAEACFDDRQKLCGAVPPGPGLTFRCLRKHRDQLRPTCRSSLYKQQVRFSQSIDFQPLMREACGRELQLYCKDVPHGEARAIRCLQDNKAQKDFGKACKDEVHDYETEALLDYRLNYLLKRNCRLDMQALCLSNCEDGGSEVCEKQALECLTENMDSIQDPACRQEVLYASMDFNGDAPAWTEPAPIEQQIAGDDQVDEDGSSPSLEYTEDGEGYTSSTFNEAYNEAYNGDEYSEDGEGYTSSTYTEAYNGAYNGDAGYSAYEDHEEVGYIANEDDEGYAAQQVYGDVPTRPCLLGGWLAAIKEAWATKGAWVLGALVSVAGLVSLLEMLFHLLRPQEKGAQQQPFSGKHEEEVQPLLASKAGCEEDGCGSYRQPVSDKAVPASKPSCLLMPPPPAAKAPPQFIDV